MNNEQKQIEFSFVAELPIMPTVKKTRRKRSEASPAVPTETGNGTSRTPEDAEAMARALETHPDYRVLRRLQPRLDWPESVPGQTVRHVLLLDTETTGLNQAKDKIIELAMLRIAVDVASGLPVGLAQVYDGLEDPGAPISREIEMLTGISTAMVRNQRLDEARIAELLADVDLVIAHNADFDRPFAEARIPQFCNLAWACSLADIDWKEQGRNSAKLESLALELGYFYDAHRAEIDCHALLAILARPLPRSNSTGLAHLMIKAEQPSYRLYANNAPFDAKDKLKARGYRWSVEQKVWNTRINGMSALQAECDWLKANAYNQHTAMVQFEELDARLRYANRPAKMVQRQL